MKPLLFVPPALSLAIAVGWVGSQRSTIAKLERETVVLQQRLKAAEAADDMTGERSLAERIQRPQEEEESIDWKGVGEGLASMDDGGMPDMRAMMKLQTHLMEMDGPELEAALDEIAALDLSMDVRRSLEGMLVGILAQKNPRLVVERFIDQLDDDRSGMSWQLPSAFQQWHKKEPAAALAWFDREIGEGTFESKSLDGKSAGRLRFEAALMSGLLDTDMAQASRRIGNLPEEQRKELFQQGMFMQMKPGAEKGFAMLVRENVPEDERAEVFGSVASNLIHQGGFERVSGFLAEIDATDAERAGLVSQVAQNKLGMHSSQGGVTRESVDEMRAWVTKESPAELDKVTGESLGNFWGEKEDYQKRIEMVEELHAEGAGDEMIVSFLGTGSAGRYPELAEGLAGKISDEARRDEILKNISGLPGNPASSVEVEATVEEE